MTGDTDTSQVTLVSLLLRLNRQPESYICYPGLGMGWRLEIPLLRKQILCNDHKMHFFTSLKWILEKNNVWAGAVSLWLVYLPVAAEASTVVTDCFGGFQHYTEFSCHIPAVSNQSLFLCLSQRSLMDSPTRSFRQAFSQPICMAVRTHVLLT